MLDLRIYSYFMPREASDQPTDVELAILRTLWDRSEATVREVHEALARQKPRPFFHPEDDASDARKGLAATQ